MKYLKSFNFDFIICGKDYMKALAMILDQRKAKDIIYIPKPKSRHSKGCKYSEVSEIIDIYRAKENSNQTEDQITGLTLLHSHSNNSIKILDLVDEDQRAVKKAFIFNRELQENKDCLDVILALDMFKEGANWIFADRCIIVGPRGSLVDVIQMIGRLFRDAKDKEHVEVIQLLPFSVSQNSEDLMENLNNYLKAICSLLILEDILKPIKILTPKRELDKKEKNSNEPLKESRLHEIISDENERKDVLNKAIIHLINLSSGYEEKKITTMETYDEFQKSLPLALEGGQKMTTYEVKLIGDYAWNLLLRDTLKMKGIDVENIDFEIIKEVFPLEGLLKFTSIHCDIDSFTRLRAAIENNRTPLTIDLILKWIELYYKEYGEYPNKNSGIIKFADEKYKGITWAHVNTALERGVRGLPGGSSLPKLLEEKFNVKNIQNLPSLSMELIEEWIKLFHAKHNRYPNRNDGIIEFATGKHKGTTWAHVNTALERGVRGLPGGSSLPKLLEEKFNVKNIKNLPNLSYKEIEGWIKFHYDKYGKYPNKNSGIIEFATGKHKGTTWAHVNTALSEGIRGLPKGSSLPKLLEEKFGVQNHMNLPNLSYEEIEEWIKFHYDKYGKYPNKNSGIIEFAKGVYEGITWSQVNTALLEGLRGLKKDSSLKRFISEKFKVRHKKNLPLYTNDLIIEFIQKYHDKVGKYPKYKSGVIITSRKEYSEDTWASIDSALRTGSRGLSGGSSLAKFIKNMIKP
jgi:hypothetical protein